jgi:hypothetical protein
MVRKWSRALAPIPALKGSAPGGPRAMSLKRDFANWAIMRSWTEFEAAALLCGLDPDSVRDNTWWLPCDKDAEFHRMTRLTWRATDERNFGWPRTPARWLAWAKKLGLPIPPELEAGVKRFWSEKQSATSVRISDETACREALVSMMKNAPDNPQPKAEVRQAQYSELPERTFNRAWASAARQANTPKWSAPDRRKNNRRT